MPENRTSPILASIARDNLARLRSSQSGGLSLKKAVKRGLVKIILTDDLNPNDRKLKEIVKL